MKKHAYLIMAHNNFYILEKLLLLLDNSNNHIYIHIDKKCKSFDFDKFGQVCKKSKVFFIKKRINVQWGTQSQIKTELALLSNAYKSGYDYSYYHILSGVDLPLKSQKEIFDFFDDKDCEFLFFRDGVSEYNLQRISIYRPRIKNKFLDEAFYTLQNKLKINRLKNCKYKSIYKGYNWASLTNNAVKLILEEKKYILKMTFCSLCADEMYKQIVLGNSDLKIYKNNNDSFDDLRFVDWSKAKFSHPYVFREADFETLINSEKMFARKFDVNTDKKIIDMIYEYLSEKNGECI